MVSIPGSLPGRNYVIASGEARVKPKTTILVFATSPLRMWKDWRGRLKLPFLTEIGQFHWNQGEKSRPLRLVWWALSYIMIRTSCDIHVKGAPMFLKFDQYRVWCSIFYSKVVNCILFKIIVQHVRFVKGRGTCGSAGLFSNAEWNYNRKREKSKYLDNISVLPTSIFIFDKTGC
jgi:hypothetical protein